MKKEQNGMRTTKQQLDDVCLDCCNRLQLGNCSQCAVNKLKRIQKSRTERMNKPKTCGECYWRDYGTDNHYVCQEGDNWFRVNSKESACPKLKKKPKEVENVN